jgi:hypothetical protein
LNLIVDGTSLSLSGTTVSSISWLAYDTTKFTISSLTPSNVGTHLFNVQWTWKDDYTFNKVFTYSFSVILACQVTSATVVSTMVSTTSYTIYAASLTIALSTYT